VPPSQVAAPPVFHRSPGQVWLVVPEMPFSFLLPSLSHVAHVAFDGRAGPDQLAGLGVARFDAADHAELAAGHAGQQQAVGDDGGGGGRVAGRVVVDLGLPDHLAGVLLQGHQLGVQRGEDHQVVVQRGAAVDHVAAGHDAFGQAVLVLPQLLAGGGVQRERRE
jgi:hypothetical protein